VNDENEPLAAGESHPWRVAAIFVLPYLLLGIAWLGSNPAGAAPDEDAHVVKALGIAGLDIGAPYVGPIGLPGSLEERIASSSRVVTIPSKLSPAGLTCFRFEPLVTAACQPESPPRDQGNISVPTSVGSYPLFLYLPIGLAAQTADTPLMAFAAARGVILLETTLLLWLASAHLVRWLGRRALVGVAVALTPVAVFCMAIVNTSGLEVFGGLGVASVVVVAHRYPESLKARRTQLTLLISGTTLILSRPLGVLTMGALVMLLLADGGWQPVWEQFRRPRRLFLATVVALGASTLAVSLWEWKFDHPVNVGPWASGGSAALFGRFFPFLTSSGVGIFGWFDTQMPTWALLLWQVLLMLLMGIAFLEGRRRDRWVLVVATTVTIMVAYILFAAVFYPIRTGVQGRHMLPLFVIVPVFAGVVITERLGRKGLVRVFSVVAVLVPVLQFLGLYINARRYAVGAAYQPLNFLGHARWEPALGWYAWLGIGCVGSVMMIVILIAFAGTSEQDSRASVAQ